jgi:hypothetical protein
MKIQTLVQGLFAAVGFFIVACASVDKLPL